ASRSSSTPRKVGPIPRRRRGRRQRTPRSSHVTARCTTCRTIERYSREDIERKFGGDIARDRLQYKLVNVQLPENWHFVKDYLLFTKSLVLVRFEKGREAEHKVLNETWELVGDKSAMQGYVERGGRDYPKKLSCSCPSLRGW